MALLSRFRSRGNRFASPLARLTLPIVRRADLQPCRTISSSDKLESEPRGGTTKEKQEQSQPQLPKFSLDGLGATPAMKAVIYTAIGIMGTVETYTYGLWIYHKLYAEEEGRNQANVASGQGGSERE